VSFVVSYIINIRERGRRRKQLLDKSLDKALRWKFK